MTFKCATFFFLLHCEVIYNCQVTPPTDLIKQINTLNPFSEQYYYPFLGSLSYKPVIQSLRCHQYLTATPYFVIIKLWACETPDLFLQEMSY